MATQPYQERGTSPTTSFWRVALCFFVVLLAGGVAVVSILYAVLRLAW